MVATRGQVVVDGNTLPYTVQTGQIPIYDNDTGDLMARMFIMAYIADRVPGHTLRPLTFIWNGGPGSSSCELHLVGFGPKAFKTPATYPE